MTHSIIEIMQLHFSTHVAYSVHNGIKITLVSYFNGHFECFFYSIKTESKAVSGNVKRNR